MSTSSEASASWPQKWCYVVQQHGKFYKEPYRSQDELPHFHLALPVASAPHDRNMKPIPCLRLIEICIMVTMMSGSQTAIHPAFLTFSNLYNSRAYCARSGKSELQINLSAAFIDLRQGLGVNDTFAVVKSSEHGIFVTGGKLQQVSAAANRCILLHAPSYNLLKDARQARRAIHCSRPANLAS